ncbi:MAG: hypothetical protein GDA56_30785 [Hormoscilla sp. GM7CHS1pb]|nr:hypothetical protein [Hormoscilla sp. GM7CHS1pb]
MRVHFDKQVGANKPAYVKKCKQGSTSLWEWFSANLTKFYIVELNCDRLLIISKEGKGRSPTGCHKPILGSKDFVLYGSFFDNAIAL